MGPQFPSAILEIAHNAFISLAADGRITEWNRRAEDLFGHARAQALGRELAELIVPERYRASHREGLQRALARVQQGQEISAPPLLHVAAIDSAGREFPVEVSVTAVREGGVTTLYGWIQDVSERAELLAELEAQLRGGGPGFGDILDALGEAVTIRDPHNHILYANRAALDHMNFESLEDMQRLPPGAIFSEYEVLDEHGRPLTIEDIPSVRLLAGEPAEPLLIRTIHRATGESRWQVLKASALADSGGQAVATVMIIEDVTAQKIAEQRDRFLAQATETLMASLDYEQTLRNVAALAVPELADWCAVELLDEHGRPQQVAVAHQDPAMLELAARLREYSPDPPDPDTGLGLVLRTGEPQLYSDIPADTLEQSASSPEHLDLLRRLGLRSALIVPLQARGRTLGAMTMVTSDSPRRLGQGDLEFAQALASRAAVAVDNARLATARRQTANTLQRSLRPEVVPEIGGWQVATMYRAAAGVEEVEVGGDFYDFVRAGDGWLVLLGDVTGKGAEAAAMTSLMRHGARFLGRDEPRPSRILERLNEALCEQPDLWLCTAICARLEPRRVVISSAGHPSPLVVGGDGAVSEVVGAGPILGAWSDVEHPERTIEVSERDTLLLYTDGVIDTPGRGGRFGIERLRERLSRFAGLAPDELLAKLESTLAQFGGRPQGDDTAAVALRPRGSAGVSG